ncbi:MAG: hypothetical protein AMJ73_08485, partial [candidate division Zixibacteria bacterium SM1_73]
LINARSSDSESVPVRGRCHVVPVVDTNYAVGEVCVQGRRLKQKPTTITASINGNEAITKVKVIQRKEKGVQIDIKLRDQDFGIYRAVWNEREGKPNQLLISTRHDSIKRYLRYNPETKEFEGDRKLPMQ